MKTWDAIVIGAGIIGLSLALELRKRGLSVLVVEKGEPGREASWAAGGMLADCPLEMPAPLREMAAASARMHPEYVAELEDESGVRTDLRDAGTLFFASEEQRRFESSYPLPRSLQELEPNLRNPVGTSICLYLKERSVDPRQLTDAAMAAASRRGVEIVSGDAALEVEIKNGRVSGVRTSKGRISAGIVVNCAGAWAGDISPIVLPTRPVKGQMLSVAMPRKELVRHVVRTPDVYLIPRSDKRLVIGATLEEAGFDKQTIPDMIKRRLHAAIALVPPLVDARVLETWAGLRPCAPDKLPILGTTSLPGYFVATGHFRDGILLAPVTARVMGQVICREKPQFDLSAFGAERFGEGETTKYCAP